MPKTKIDYSNTIIYRIFCKNENVSDLYIGHTTNFSQRKSCHKNSCENPNNSLYNIKLYKTIRENGGFDNFIIEPIEYGYFDNIEKVIKREFSIKRGSN